MTKSSDHQDFSAPQRPKLRLLRTLRFWFGFGMLILLIGTWIGAILFDGGIERHQSSIYSGARWEMIWTYYHTDFWRVDYDSCCLSFHWGRAQGTFGPGLSTIYLPPPDAWKWWFQKADASRSNPGMEDYPFGPCYFPKIIGSSGDLKSIPDGQAGKLEHWIAFPLWLPVILWLIIWPLWIRRLTRKEAVHFARLQ